MKKLAKWIRDRRTTAGLTQAELARKVGASPEKKCQPFQQEDAACCALAPIRGKGLPLSSPEGGDGM